MLCGPMVTPDAMIVGSDFFYERGMNARRPTMFGGQGCPFTTGCGVGEPDMFNPQKRSRLARDGLIVAAEKNSSMSSETIHYVLVREGTYFIMRLDTDFTSTVEFAALTGDIR